MYEKSSENFTAKPENNMLIQDKAKHKGIFVDVGKIDNLINI